MSTTRETVEALIETASRLIALMQREVEILHAMRPADIGPLQAEKSALSLEYERLIDSLADEPEILASLGGALHEEFVRVAARFDEALAENERALHAARTAQSRLIKAIAEAVGNQRQKASGYSATGARQPGRRHDPSRPLAFDTTL